MTVTQRYIDCGEAAGRSQAQRSQAQRSQAQRSQAQRSQAQRSQAVSSSEGGVSKAQSESCPVAAVRFSTSSGLNMIMHDVHLTIKNQGGSVQHYYHFLLGFLLPCVIKISELQDDASVGRCFIRSCGPMNSLIQELGFSKLKIIDRTLHAQLSESEFSENNLPLLKQKIDGMDSGAGNYDRKSIICAVHIITEKLGANISEQKQVGLESFDITRRRILLIKRGWDPFYKSNESEIKTSGAERRSIKNFNELQAALERRVGNVRAITLEGTALAFQIALFSLAHVIVSQHGAAFSNLIWALPRTRVIEIRHRLQSHENCFPSLSLLMGLEHYCAPQGSNHGNCDIEKIIEFVTM